MKWLIPLLFLSSVLTAKQPDVYQHIPDIAHPRMCDWVRIQEFLQRGKREQLRLLDQAVDAGGVLFDYRCRARRFRLIGKHFWERPEYKIVPIGVSSEERDVCVITYASFNHRYPQAVKLLQKQLEEVGFRGHFLYRIGGWPDLEGGSLTLAHIPYAFKPCFFKEAERLGYRKILWLDASIRPVRSLDEVFEEIEQKGYFLYPSGSSITPFCTKEAIDAFGLTVEEARRIRPLSAGLVGLNAAHPKGKEAIERWMEAARGEAGFLSPRPDQNALSMIVYLLGMQDWEPIETLSWGKEAVSEQSRFFIDYPSVR